jgi:hypothetical protein
VLSCNVSQADGIISDQQGGESWIDARGLEANYLLCKFAFDLLGNSQAI